MMCYFHFLSGCYQVYIRKLACKQLHIDKHLTLRNNIYNYVTIQKYTSEFDNRGKEYDNFLLPIFVQEC